MSSELRVLQVIGSRGGGGAEAFFLKLVKALQPHLNVIPVIRVNSWLSARLREHGIPFHEVNFGGTFDFMTKMRLRRIIDEVKPDVIQTWMNRASSFIPKTSIPTIGRLGGYYNLSRYKDIDYLVGNTIDICRYIQTDGRHESKIFHIGNFVEEPVDLSMGRVKVRNRLGIPDDRQVVLLAGRLHQIKGFDIALRSLVKFRDQITLIIAGDGPEKANLIALADQLGLSDNTHFLGWVDDISPYFSASDLLLVPSRHEALGNAVLEGWAHRLPVIASETDGPKRLISNRENGILVPINDIKSLENAVAYLLDNKELARKISSSGYGMLQEKFSKNSIVSKYIDMYQLVQKTFTEKNYNL